jgi:hypothetical protein
MNPYCVILCRRHDNANHHPRFKRFYVDASNAERAVLDASRQHPLFRVIGIEHSDLQTRMNEASEAA